MDENFFTLGKSAVNFCEQDIYWMGIGEPWNVISSFGIVFFGLYGLYITNYVLSSERKFTNEKKTKLNILYGLLALIGLGSVYFHSKLSPFAHWVDIIFISIMLVYSQYVLSAQKNKLINKIKYLGLLAIHFATSIYIPQVHIFFLFGTGFAIKNRIEYKLEYEFLTLINISDSSLQQRYWWIKNYFTLALGFWILDYFGCWFISPYHVHWIFHILIGLVPYKIILLLNDLD